MAIFVPKPWANPFGKSAIFSLFKLFFIAQKGVFFVLEYRKTHFRGLFWKKRKKLSKSPFLSKNHGLTPLEKWQFFDFLNFLFYSLEMCFFVLECRKRHFPWPILRKKKEVGQMAIFRPNPWVYLFGKKPIFKFLNFSFLKPRKAFFRSKIS